MAEGRPPLLPATDPSALREAATAMLAGGIVGIPTETVYGIGVVPRPEALAAVIAAKQRPDDKGIALLIELPPPALGCATTPAIRPVPSVSKIQSCRA